MLLRILFQWLLIGFLLKGLWSLIRLLSGGQHRDATRRPPARRKRTAEKPPWDPDDVLDVGYEEVPRRSKTS